MVDHDPAGFVGLKIQGPVDLGDGKILRELGHPGSAILEIENAVPLELCQRLMDAHNADPNRYTGYTGYLKTTQAKGKDSIDSDMDAFPEWHAIRDEMYSHLRPALDKIFADYYRAIRIYPLTATDFRATSYPPHTGHFCWHSDQSMMSIRRVAAGIVYLNDVPEGGETEFHYQEASVKPKAGKFVMFPTTWNYIHRGSPSPYAKYLVVFFFYVGDSRPARHTEPPEGAR